MMDLHSFFLCFCCCAVLATPNSSNRPICDCVLCEEDAAGCDARRGAWGERLRLIHADGPQPTPVDTGQTSVRLWSNLVKRWSTQVAAEVDTGLRRRIRAHHTATHLLQSALKRVLGPDTCQQGSLVDEQRLRCGCGLMSCFLCRLYVPVFHTLVAGLRRAYQLQVFCWTSHSAANIGSQACSHAGIRNACLSAPDMS